MKVTSVILSLFLYLTSYSQNEVVSVQEKDNQENKSNATIDFESKVVDYGTIAHGSDGNREFTFTNNGTEPLIIKNARASCGCTVPDWPKEPIMPGKTEKIKVNYATNRVGKFTKNITLTTNVDKKPVILTIKGEVSPPQNKDKTLPTKNTEGSPRE
tara:strand:- start:10682 stop:11152 length:471 start_codon:yes stop_codon:yes gene_type:complete